MNLVQQAHPDLVRDEDHRRLRNEFMVRVILAYGEGDESTFEAFSDEWSLINGPIEEESIGDKLVRVIRRIADVRRRMNEIDTETGELKNSDDYSMVMQAEETRANGKDMVAEHVAQMDEHVAELGSNIDGIRDQLVAL